MRIPTMRSGLARLMHRLAVGMSTMVVPALLAACFDTSRTTGPTQAVPPARLAISAKIALSSTPGGSSTAQLKVQPSYLRVGGAKVPLGDVLVIALSDSSQQHVPLTIELKECLQDDTRASVTGGTPAADECAVVLAMQLMRDSVLVDQMSLGPVGLAPGKQTAVEAPVVMRDIASIDVLAPPANLVAVGLPFRLEMGATMALATRVLDMGGKEVPDRRPVWSSLTPTIATVTAAGVVTPVAPGSARIAATINGRVGVGDVRVVLAPMALTISGSVSSGQGSVRSQPAGIDCTINATTVSGGCSAAFPSDGSATLTATPATNAVFSGWTGACAAITGNVCILTTGQPRTTAPRFTAKRTLTLTGVGAGAGVLTTDFGGLRCVITAGAASGSCTTDILDGTVVAITVAATAPSTFRGWIGDCAVASGTTCNLLMSADRDVVARLELPVAVVSVIPAAPSVAVGMSQAMTAMARDAIGNALTGRLVYWTTGDPAIAAISTTGVVTGLSVGTTTITATVDGISASTTVTVTPARVATVTVTPAVASLLPGSTQAFVATARDANGTVLTGRPVLWSSTNAPSGAISAAGVLTAYAQGTITVTATVEGVDGTATVTVRPVPVAAVTVSPAGSTVYLGNTQQMTASARDAAGAALTGRGVVWSVSDTTVATISPTGLVTTLKVGRVTVTATVEGVAGSSTITVVPVPIASVGVVPGTATIQTDATLQLIATARDIYDRVATGRSVAWTSSDPAVATVSATGVVTGKSAGTVSMTATVEGVQGVATITVVPIPVASVQVNPASVPALSQFATQAMTATAYSAQGAVLTGRAVIWRSSNSDVATISTGGIVTGVLAGITTISAEVEGVTGTASVTVVPAVVARVAITPVNPTLLVGGTLSASATAYDAAGNTITGRAVTWTSSAATVASVTTNGVVSAVSAGTATISGTVDGVSGTTTVTVSAIPAASVTVTPATASVIIGNSRELTATVKDGQGNVLTGRSVTWSSSNGAIVSVSSVGVINALALGGATITASVEGVQGTSAITVIPVPVASVTLSPTSASLAVGATQQFTATANDANGNVLTGRTVSWTLDNATVASVSSGGLLTAVAAGNATLTATVGGVSATAAITVTASSGTAALKVILTAQDGGFSGVSKMTINDGISSQQCSLASGATSSSCELTVRVGVAITFTLNASGSGNRSRFQSNPDSGTQHLCAGVSGNSCTVTLTDNTARRIWGYFYFDN
ncbi:MAG: Ig-like domain-containing protein [Gemmatimonadaceae bacterium]